VALHGNMKNLASGPLAGPQFYPYCFNIDVINGGSATPDGVNFPGGYKATDSGLTFGPYMTYDEKADPKEGSVHNSKYVRHCERTYREMLIVLCRFLQVHVCTRGSTMRLPEEPQW
jgi:hypothetical protein